MNTSSILFAAVTTLAASAAFATTGEATYDYPQPIAPVASRADVRAEAVAARSAGLIVSGEASGSTGAASAARAPRVAAPIVADALPLNAEAMTFDGRAPHARMRADVALLAKAPR